MKNQIVNKMTLRFPSKSSNEAFARAAVASFAAQTDPTIDELNDIKTAVSEAVTNCIVHAYADTVGMITISAAVYAGGILEIKIRDSGCGISDVDKAREPMFTTGGSERSGMGFTIMESFMDGFKVLSRVGKGTTLTLRKRMTPRVSANTAR